MFRSGTVALVGRANVGKSTFFNTALGEPLAIVSSYPQTTRDALLGVVRTDLAELALIDSPGFHKPHNELGRRMNLAASNATQMADHILLFIDLLALSKPMHERQRRTHGSEPSLSAEDVYIIDELPKNTPWSIVLNKVDQLRNKSQILPMLAKLGARYPERTIIPISSLDSSDVARVLNAVASELPERPARYGSDELTDRPLRFFAAEYIREQVMRTTHGELPFAIAVAIDEFSELESLVVIQATISVEKDGQRVILIGAKAIRSAKLAFLQDRE